ncbi:MAG: RNA-binding protein [Anaerolineales bacterium]
MNSKLYIGNLSTLTTEKELMELFRRAGTVNSVWLSKEQGSGRSKGFAYIEMNNTVEAQKAIEMFNGQQLDDHVLRVSMASHIADNKRK